MTVVESVSKPSQQAETARELTACLTESLAGAPRRAEREGRWHVSLRRRLILGGASAGRRWTKTESTALPSVRNTPKNQEKILRPKSRFLSYLGVFLGPYATTSPAPGGLDQLRPILHHPGVKSPSTSHSGPGFPIVQRDKRKRRQQRDEALGLPS